MLLPAFHPEPGLSSCPRAGRAPEELPAPQRLQKGSGGLEKGSGGWKRAQGAAVLHPTDPCQEFPCTEAALRSPPLFLLPLNGLVANQWNPAEIKARVFHRPGVKQGSCSVSPGSGCSPGLCPVQGWLVPGGAVGAAPAPNTDTPGTPREPQNAMGTPTSSWEPRHPHGDPKIPWEL